MHILKKRGQSQMLWIVIGIIFVVIIILLSSYIISRFGATVGSINEQASVAGYHTLGKTIKDLVKSPEYFKKTKLRLPVDEYASIVAFNKGDEYSLDACHPLEAVPKPDVCGNNTCICYYNPGTDEDFEDNQLSKEPCILLPEVDYVFSFYYADWYYERYFSGFLDAGSQITDYYGIDSSVYKNIVGDELFELELPDYYPRGHSRYFSYLFLYGECDAWSYDINFNDRMMYIEKFKNPMDNKVYILIAADSGRDYIAKREQILKSEVDKRVKKTPSEFLAMINTSYQAKDFSGIYFYSGLFDYYYAAEPQYRNESLQIKQIVEKAKNEEKILAEQQSAEIEKIIAEVNPPGFPPGFSQSVP